MHINFIKYTKYYFLISALFIVPGLIALMVFGLKPSIDFTGGSRYEIQIPDSNFSSAEVEEKIAEKEIDVVTVQKINDTNFIIRTDILDQQGKEKLAKGIEEVFPEAQERSFETVGATIGRETTLNAFYAVVIASVAIALYIAIMFREVSRPVASWKFGVAAIAALIHDVLVVVGAFAILGYFFHIEVDSLFITALLTVIGFSVHDTIVVFDRIRENIKKHAHVSFEVNVNNSILETLNRSLNTSITVVLVLLMLLLFGGDSIRWFVVALLIGIISGTYSSIFNASQILVVWYQWGKKN